MTTGSHPSCQSPRSCFQSTAKHELMIPAAPISCHHGPGSLAHTPSSFAHHCGMSASFTSQTPGPLPQFCHLPAAHNTGISLDPPMNQAQGSQRVPVMFQQDPAQTQFSAGKTPNDWRLSPPCVPFALCFNRHHPDPRGSFRYE